MGDSLLTLNAFSGVGGLTQSRHREDGDDEGMETMSNHEAVRNYKASICARRDLLQYLF
jgi:hypothetical protein